MYGFEDAVLYFRINAMIVLHHAGHEDAFGFGFAQQRHLDERVLIDSLGDLHVEIATL